jgi:hypothetical protein
VDGDCLLLEILGSDRVDWEHGGQFLQLRAELELFVERLRRANVGGLRYWVVFFDGNAGLLPDAAARLARALMREWLPALGVPALRFSSWWGADWQEWLAGAHPSLLLMTDKPLASDDRSSELFLYAYVAHIVQHGLQGAFLRELRFSADGRVFAFRTSWRAAKAEHRAGGILRAASAVGQAFAEAAHGGSGSDSSRGVPASVLALLGDVPAGRWGGPVGCLQTWRQCWLRTMRNPTALQLFSDPTPGLASDIAALPRCNVPPLLADGMRAALGAAVCGLLAAQPPAGLAPDLLQLFTRAWCTHELLLRSLPLRQRSLHLPLVEAAGTGGRQLEEVERWLSSYLSAFHAAAEALLGAAPAGPGPLALDASMADWLDGRLLHCLVVSLWQGRPGNPATEEEAQLERLVDQAALAAGGELLTWLRPTSAAAGPLQRPGPDGVCAPERVPPRLLPVLGNALVDVVSGGDTALLLHDPSSREVLNVLREQSAAYSADFHWHSGKPRCCKAWLPCALQGWPPRPDSTVVQ